MFLSLALSLSLSPVNDYSCFAAPRSVSRLFSLDSERGPPLPPPSPREEEAGTRSDHPPVGFVMLIFDIRSLPNQFSSE